MNLLGCKASARTDFLWCLVEFGFVDLFRPLVDLISQLVDSISQLVD